MGLNERTIRKKKRIRTRNTTFVIERMDNGKFFVDPLVNVSANLRHAFEKKREKENVSNEAVFGIHNYL